MAGKNGNGSAGVDLSGLDQLGGFGDMSFGSLIEGGAAAGPATIIKESDGKPLMLKLDDIEEDPDQPRKEFDLTEMRASIRAKVAAGQQPFKTPISVKTHPTKPGKWLLNDGARRYRSAKEEDLTEVPAFIDEEHDDYDQVIVNIQRDGHTPLEIANFIQKREAKGDKKGQIAKRLGKSASFVSKHAALIDMPPSVRQAYAEGRCREVEALYLLVNNFEAYPEQIDTLCLTGPEVISKYTVAELLDSLKNPKPPAAPAGSTEGGPANINAGFDNPNAGASDGSGHHEAATNEPGTTTGAAGHDDDHQQGSQDDEGKGEGKGTKQPDPDKIRKAIVQIEHDERPARLLLDRRAAVGLAWIKYDDDGHEIEVEIGTAKLIAIVEGA
ncbi:MAG: ParB/RepB/Spo0J family partition protein [Burkholderia gladioli]